MNAVTHLLLAVENGDPHASGELLPLVYDELRRLAAHRLAHEAPGQTLQRTALVQEANLRLLGDEAAAHWENRGHFFAAAAEAMCRIQVEQARRKRCLRCAGPSTRGWMSPPVAGYPREPGRGDLVRGRSRPVLPARCRRDRG